MKRTEEYITPKDMVTGMKNRTVKVTIIIICLVLALVGYYTYLSNRSRERKDEVSLTAVQAVMSRDLTRDYPATPKEVMKYYNEIMKCFYNEECTDEEIELLGNRARELYDWELLEANEQETYIQRLREEIKAFQAGKKRLTNTSVAASTNVDYFEEDGFSFARILCSYNIMDNGVTKFSQAVYLLRQDDQKHWKIYGWDAKDNVNIQE